MSGNHKGGFGEPMSGFDSEGNSLTVSFGWGTDQSSRDFMQDDNYNHYGSGNGQNGNVKDRGMYSGSWRLIPVYTRRPEHVCVPLKW